MAQNKSGNLWVCDCGSGVCYIHVRTVTQQIAFVFLLRPGKGVTASEAGPLRALTAFPAGLGEETRDGKVPRCESEGSRHQHLNPCCAL